MPAPHLLYYLQCRSRAVRQSSGRSRECEHGRTFGRAPRHSQINRNLGRLRPRCQRD